MNMDPDGRITASYETLMSQASEMVDEYLSQAVRRIDRQFAPGYSRKHPELVGAFLVAAGIDFSTSVIVKNMQVLMDSVDRLTDTVEELRP